MLDAGADSYTTREKKWVEADPSSFSLDLNVAALRFRSPDDVGNIAQNDTKTGKMETQSTQDRLLQHTLDSLTFSSLFSDFDGSVWISQMIR